MSIYFKCKRDDLRPVLNQLRGSISHTHTKGLTLPLSITFEPKTIRFTCLKQTLSIVGVCDKKAQVDLPFRIFWKALAEHSSENFTGVIKEGKLKIGTYEVNDDKIHIKSTGKD